MKSIRKSTKPIGGEKFSVIQYDSGLIDEWDSFVDASRNGTLFHKQRFLSYHPPGRFLDRSLIVKKRGRTAAVFTAAEVSHEGKRILFSHPGSSYGGLVIGRDFGLRDSFCALEAIIAFARERGLDSIEMRHAPRVFQKLPSEELDFALWKTGFRYSKRELSGVVSLRPLMGRDVLRIFGNGARGKVRKSIRAGLRFAITRSEDHIETFHAFLARNLGDRHGTGPTHSLDELKRLMALFPDDIILTAAMLGDRPIGFIVLFVGNRKAVYVFYTAQDFAYSPEFRQINFLYYHAILWARERGFDYLDIGISTEQGGELINWSLYHFKESHGCHGVRRDSYCLDLKENP